MKAPCKTITAMLTSLGNPNKGPQSSHSSQDSRPPEPNQATIYDFLPTGPEPLDPQPSQPLPRKRNRNKTRKKEHGPHPWLTTIQKVDFRTADIYHCHELQFADTLVPICDTATHRLLLDPGAHANIECLAMLAHQPWHGQFQRITTRPGSASSGSTLSETDLVPRALPSHILLAGVLTVVPLNHGQHDEAAAKNVDNESNFAAVIDATDPALPLWAIWAYHRYDHEAEQYVRVFPKASDLLFRMLPLSPGRLYDAVLLGNVADARQKGSGGSPIFPLKTVLRHAEATRSVQEPRVSRAPLKDAQQAVVRGWAARDDVTKDKAKTRQLRSVGHWFRSL